MNGCMKRLRFIPLVRRLWRPTRKTENDEL